MRTGGGRCAHWHLCWCCCWCVRACAHPCPCHAALPRGAHNAPTPSHTPTLPPKRSLSFAAWLSPRLPPECCHGASCVLGRWQRCSGACLEAAASRRSGQTGAPAWCAQQLLFRAAGWGGGGGTSAAPGMLDPSSAPTHRSGCCPPAPAEHMPTGMCCLFVDCCNLAVIPCAPPCSPLSSAP